VCFVTFVFKPLPPSAAQLKRCNQQLDII
jgi:hypothetical protein